jgi:hypothetical protein
MTIMKEQKNSRSQEKGVLPTFLKFILIVVGWQTYRAFAAIGFSDIEVLGGSILPDAWVIPIWQDTMTGLLAPFIVFILAKRPSILSYALGVGFFVFGIVDFTNGIIIDALYPSLNDDVPNGVLSVWLAVNMIIEIIALALFLSPSIRAHFNKQVLE